MNVWMWIWKENQHKLWVKKSSIHYGKSWIISLAIDAIENVKVSSAHCSRSYTINYKRMTTFSSFQSIVKANIAFKMTKTSLVNEFLKKAVSYYFICLSLRRYEWNEVRLKYMCVLAKTISTSSNYVFVMSNNNSVSSMCSTIKWIWNIDILDVTWNGFVTKPTWINFFAAYWYHEGDN